MGQQVGARFQLSEVLASNIEFILPVSRGRGLSTDTV